MGLYYKLDENKNAIPCALREWSEMIQRKDDRIVAFDEIRKIQISTVFLGMDLSTVFLGMDLNFDGEGKPLIFETMVFDENGHDIYMKRFSTWSDAEIGHEEAKEWVKNGCKYD